jgi:hypothetical protein
MANDMICGGANNKQIKMKSSAQWDLHPPNTLNTLTSQKTKTRASDDEQ